MLNKLRQRTTDEKGFTLIELLVVILIIGILAAIAIPSFLGQRDKANDSKAKSDARTVQTALETWYTDNQSYVGATLAELKKIEPTLNESTVTANPTVGASNFGVVATSKTGTTFTITRVAAGTTTRTCSVVGKGGCKAADANGNQW